MYEGQSQPEGMMGNSLLLLLCGAAVGATVALLYAPKSGREARAQIRASANQVKDTAGEWKEKAMSTVHETLDCAAETIKSASDGFNPNQTEVGARA
jgi:gas vesicle protein